MESHDGSYHHLAAADPSLQQQHHPQSADPATSFMTSSHPDVPPHPHSAPATHQAPTLFPKDVGSGNPLPIPMDVTLASIPPPPMDVTPMDILNAAAPHHRTSAPDAMTTYQSVLNGSYAEEPQQERSAQSPPMTNSGSSYPSHSSSPSIPGLNAGFSGPSSSIASALDSLGVTVSRSRSGSLASGGHFLGTTGEVGISSAGSGPPTSSQGSGFHFSPREFEVQVAADKEASPDVPGGPHLMVVGDMLKNIVHTANAARAACSTGQSVTAGVKIDELKKTIALVSELIAATRLADSPPSDSASPPHLSGLGAPSARASPPHLTSMASSSALQQQQIAMRPPGSLEIGEGQTSESPESRKRCASSLAGDRVIKALKLEPQDEPTLQSASSVSFPFSPPSTAGPMSAVEYAFPSNPPSALPSRPGSSSGGIPPGALSNGIPLHHLFPPTHPPSQLSNMNFAPPPVQMSNITPRRSIDFSATAVGPSGASPLVPSHMPSYDQPPEPQGQWPDQSMMYTQQPQQHVQPTGSLNGVMDLPKMNISVPPPPYPPPSFTSPISSQHPQNPSVPPSMGGPLSHDVPHISRTSSMSSASIESSFTYNIASAPSAIDEEYHQSRPGTAISPRHSPDSSQDDDDRDSEYGDYPQSQSQSQSPPLHGEFRSRLGSLDNGAGGVATAYNHAGHPRRALATRPSMENFGSSMSTSAGHGNEVPQEYRAEVDRIFFEFLTKTCSNLDATDAKGEPIHQTLMAKKMQRLDESPDFRPFKFRIQAFTNAFLEELARQGYPEDKIPMKKIRNYLWNSSYISRFNEDGKKAKSKGNHIWNIEAKKAPEGGWIFRPFHRRLAGLPPGVAYVGLRWSWTPRIWDPQASRSNLPVQYTSPSLPSWLSWQDDTLSGIPPPDAQSCDVTVDARPSAILRPAPAAPAPVPSQDAQVIQVLTTAAQRVAQEAQSQVVASRIPSEPGPELQALAKQQHVLTVTAQAVDKTVSGQGKDAAEPSSVLAAAAQQVVLQAARQVAADHSAVAAAQFSAGLPPTPASSSQVTVNEVSVATQSAVAQAVEIAGPLSSEVDVLMTASSLLQQQSRPAPMPSAPALDPSRPHSTGTVLPRSFAAMTPGIPLPPEANFFPANPPPIPPLDLISYSSHS
ncbi:hypothetical protein EWM64_g1641 [Hericium alpestre]|uniref:Uncharacterized protein n=1 Tax=Hericium alpestre TaxID=135208 RepID=A0A4Z0A8X0_9AGAM|nr:hypothetical protein EWM64_g1641 [Hericium alpestre]